MYKNIPYFVVNYHPVKESVSWGCRYLETYKDLADTILPVRA